MNTERAIFLDRDGVLNHNVWYESSQEWESPRSADAVVLYDGVVDALGALRSCGWRLVLVSNQPSFAKGKTTMEALREVHTRLEAERGRRMHFRAGGHSTMKTDRAIRLPKWVWDRPDCAVK